MIATVPALAAGFRADTIDGRTVVVNEGPVDTAAGVFGGDAPTGAELWSRQVLSYGRLRAVVLDGPAGFDAVHTVAERVAATLGIGAVQVAVSPAERGFAIHTTDSAAAVSILDEQLRAMGATSAILLASGAAA